MDNLNGLKTKTRTKQTLDHVKSGIKRAMLVARVGPEKLSGCPDDPKQAVAMLESYARSASRADADRASTIEDLVFWTEAAIWFSVSKNNEDYALALSRVSDLRTILDKDLVSHLCSLKLLWVLNYMESDQDTEEKREFKKSLENGDFVLEDDDGDFNLWHCLTCLTSFSRKKLHLFFHPT